MRDPCPRLEHGMKMGFVPLCSPFPWRVFRGCSLPAVPGSCSQPLRMPGMPMKARLRARTAAHPAECRAARGCGDPGSSAGAVGQLVKLIVSEEGWRVPSLPPDTLQGGTSTLSTELGFLMLLHCWVSRGKIFPFISLICVQAELVWNHRLWMPGGAVAGL